MKVAALRIGGEAERWRRLGFQVDEDIAMLGGIRVELLPSAEPGVISSWALEGAGVPPSIDGLSTDTATRGGPEALHPNGAVGIDHLVVITPSLERTGAALAELGVDCRRVRETDRGVRQGFFLVGDLLLEALEGSELPRDAPASFWGITAVVADIDHAAALLGDRLGRIKAAVQPDRCIATVRRAASGGLPLALITPRG